VFVPIYKNETETTEKLVIEDKPPNKVPDQKNEDRSEPKNDVKEHEKSLPIFIWVAPERNKPRPS
jgi:hypothetical protein